MHVRRALSRTHTSTHANGASPLVVFTFISPLPMQVQSLVKKNPKVRAIGLGHSFNRGVCANGGLMLDMSGMNQVSRSLRTCSRRACCGVRRPAEARCLDRASAWQALELNTVDKYVRTQPGISTRGLLAWLRER
jgi:FAD/FMN-containing dehydrogenase